jgi:hypothetical protein
MNNDATKRVDLRFNEIRDAVVELSNALKDCPLNDEALAILISSSYGCKANKTQALSVIQHMKKLQKTYLNKSGNLL